LTEAQHRRLGDILDSGPVAYGLDTGIWTSPMIAWVVEEEFGVVYHPGRMRKLLHDPAFSVQRPRRVRGRHCPQLPAALASTRKENDEKNISVPMQG